MKSTTMASRYVVIDISLIYLRNSGYVFQVIFLEAAEARAAFKGLAYKRYKYGSLCTFLSYIWWLEGKIA